MLKVQEQHQAGSTSSHLPQSAFPVPSAAPRKVNTPLAVSQMGSVCAAMAVPPSGPGPPPPPPPCAATSGTQLFIYLCALLFLFSFLESFLVSYLFLLAVSLPLMGLQLRPTKAARSTIMG